MSSPVTSELTATLPPRSVIENAELLIALLEVPGQAHGKIPHHDLDNVRVAFAQALEVGDGQEVALDLGVGRHRRRTGRFIQQRHFPKDHAGRKSAQPLHGSVGSRQHGAGAATVQEIQLPGLRSDRDDDFILLEFAALEARLD